MFEVFTEKRLVGEIQMRRYLLNGQVGGFKEHFGLHRHISFNPFAGSAA